MLMQSPPDIILVTLLVLSGVGISIKANKLTVAGALTGGVIAIIIYAGAGYKGLAMLGAFFILGTLATSWMKEEKRKIHASEKQQRTAGQVLANGGVAALAGLAGFIFTEYAGIFTVMMAAGLASATADTLSSELGMVYGKRFYNIMSWKREPRGLDGVVSIEGFLIGIAGSFIIALIAASKLGVDKYMLIIIIAGTVGNITDSVLGAVLERKRFINNDTVNFLNTLVAALTALLLMPFI